MRSTILNVSFLCSGALVLAACAGSTATPVDSGAAGPQADTTAPEEVRASGYTDLADPEHVQWCIDQETAGWPALDGVFIEWAPFLYNRGEPVMNQLTSNMVEDLFCSIILAGGVKLIGHTDTVGSAEDNMALSLQVAGEVRDAMVAQGIDPAVIDVEGRGETELVIPTEDEVPNQANRRISWELPW